MAKEKSERKTKEGLEDVEMADVTEEKVSNLTPALDLIDHFLQSPRKSKKDKEEIVIPLEDLSPIAHPLAQRKLARKLHKTIKKG